MMLYNPGYTNPGKCLEASTVPACTTLLLNPAPLPPPGHVLAPISIPPLDAYKNPGARSLARDSEYCGTAAHLWYSESEDTTFVSLARQAHCALESHTPTHKANLLSLFQGVRTNESHSGWFENVFSESSQV